MWPGQINCGPGYGQPQRLPVFPSQDHTQQGIMLMNSQSKGDVFLAQPNAMSQNVNMQTSKEQVIKIEHVYEPCYVTLSNPSGDSTSARIATQDGFTFEIIPNSSVSEVSRHPNNPQHIPLQYPQQGSIPSSQVQLGLNSGQQTHYANSNQEAQQHANSRQQVQQCSNISLQLQQGPNSNLQVQQGPNSGLQASNSRQNIPNMEETPHVTSTSSHLDMSFTGLGKTPFGMGNTPNEMGDMQSATQNSNSAFNASRLQTVLTLQWLMENYETCESYSVPRCVVYDQYTDFCASNSFNPLNPATFGKLIRQVFVNLKTRRLGIRGQSKYHYYGIRVKRTSELSHSDEHFTSEPKLPKHTLVPSNLMITDIDNTIKPNKNQSTMDSTTEDSPVAGPVDRSLSPVTALGLALIPQFPKAFMLKSLPSIANLDKVDTFLTEYRTHCEYLLEAILKGKFSEIFSQMVIFWENLSAANLQLLKMGYLAGTIKFCDILLYKTIISILIPGTTLEVPQSLLKAVRIFAKDFRSKLSKHIQELPTKVFEAKNEAATSFVKLLVRKTTLSHIAQATRAILKNSRAVKMMRADWREKTDLENLRRKIEWLIVDVHIDEDRPDLYRCKVI
ncbi:transcription factor RFX4-like [Anneissia japonica]|uniref:transcription factor RFX4-like n=1 Tax=Anneissia japonica TaxID=1529436 RepID=UPI0014259931|nr:transcription factor RFX4-like [Anneissia japonica]